METEEKRLGAAWGMKTTRIANLSVSQSVCYTGEGYAYPITEQKTKLTFADFLGTEVGAKTHVGNTITTTLNCVQGFSDIFSNQYEQMKEQLKDSEGKQLTYEEYLELLTHMGEFDHAMNKPLASFLSGLLDITIFKPILEACTGTDLITKEDLSDTERALKAVFAVVDVVTLGQAIGATNIIKISSKETLKQLGRIAVVELGTNAAGYTVGALGEQLNLPVWITLLLSMGSGAAVNQMLNEKLILVNASAFGTMSPEDAGEYMKFLKEGSTEGLTQQELLGIQKVDDWIVLNGVDYDEILGLRNGIGEDGVSKIKYKEVKTFTAEETNQWFLDNVKPDYKPPYKPGTIVKEIELMENTIFVRVYDNMPDSSGMYGSWLMKAEDIEGLTPLEIQNKFALPNIPKYVCDVELDVGTHIRVGEVNPLEGWGSGGGTQYDLIGQRIGDFKNERLLEGN